MYADALARLLESVASHIEAKQALVETYCGPGKVYDLLQKLQAKCDELAFEVIKRFKQRRHLSAISEKVSRVLKEQSFGSDKKGIKVEHLNDLLIEIALMSKQFEVYIGFVKRRAVQDIDVAFPKQNNSDSKYKN